jgi:hypothetical protein
VRVERRRSETRTQQTRNGTQIRNGTQLDSAGSPLVAIGPAPSARPAGFAPGPGGPDPGLGAAAVAGTRPGGGPHPSGAHPDTGPVMLASSTSPARPVLLAPTGRRIAGSVVNEAVSPSAGRSRDRARRPGPPGRRPSGRRGATAAGPAARCHVPHDPGRRRSEPFRPRPTGSARPAASRASTDLAPTTAGRRAGGSRPVGASSSRASGPVAGCGKAPSRVRHGVPATVEPSFPPARAPKRDCDPPSRRSRMFGGPLAIIAPNEQPSSRRLDA